MDPIIGIGHRLTGKGNANRYLCELLGPPTKQRNDLKAN
jgi:hypothetical protein